MPDSIHPSVLGYFEIGLALFAPIRGALLESRARAAPPRG
jgi:hypothetical protein